MKIFELNKNTCDDNIVETVQDGIKMLYAWIFYLYFHPTLKSFQLGSDVADHRKQMIDSLAPTTMKLTNFKRFLISIYVWYRWIRCMHIFWCKYLLGDNLDSNCHEMKNGGKMNGKGVKKSSTGDNFKLYGCRSFGLFTSFTVKPRDLKT